MVQISAPPSPQRISTDDPSVLLLLHAFTKPRQAAEAGAGFAHVDPAVLRSAITDFQQAGFIVPASDLVADEDETGAARTGATDVSSLKASVIMPTHDKAPYLDLTLASYLNQTCSNFELVVVDDGSSDDTRDVVARYEQRLNLKFLSQSNAGRAAARNYGIGEATGDILIFSDDDRIVGPAFVAKHLAAYSSADDKAYGLGWMYGIVSLLHRDILGPVFPALAKRLGTGDEAEQLVALTQPELVAKQYEQTITELGTVDPDWERKVTPVVERFGEQLTGLQLPWFLGSTGNMSAPKALVTEVGMFDVGYAGYGMEDTDICYALSGQGASCRLLRQAVNHHQLHPKYNVSAELRRSLDYFCKKYDCLETYLFARWFFGDIDITTANDIVLAAPGDDQHRAALLDELKTVLREQTTMRLG